MMAVKLKGTVTVDHRLELTMPLSVPPGEVEVIILHTERRAKPKRRVRQPDPHMHPAAEIWADRKISTIRLRSPRRPLSVTDNKGMSPLSHIFSVSWDLLSETWAAGVADAMIKAMTSIRIIYLLRKAWTGLKMTARQEHEGTSTLIQGKSMR